MESLLYKDNLPMIKRNRTLEQNIQPLEIYNKMNVFRCHINNSLTETSCNGRYACLYIGRVNTDKNILEDSPQLIKHFLDFPLWQQRISSLSKSCEEKKLCRGSGSPTSRVSTSTNFTKICTSGITMQYNSYKWKLGMQYPLV